MRIRATALVVATAVLTAATVSTAPQSRYARIVVFGTSLSDPGNAYALGWGVNTAPDYQLDPLLVPSAPYARGGHHFSNGPTWIEQFAQSAGLATSVGPAFADGNPNATNYAVGGARAREDGTNVNLPTQLATFLQRSGGIAPADGLYVIEMGGNDVRDALLAYPAGHGVVLEEAVRSIAGSIQMLYAAGARDFLVWRAPNVSLTPAIRTLDHVTPGAAFLAGEITRAFNTALDNAVASLSALPGIRIVRLDAYRILSDLVATPAAFGLTDVMNPCITPNVPPFSCASPEEFVFWDGIHPTATVHGIITLEAARALPH
jgi:phospholipase/lecithinase/hemolysin